MKKSGILNSELSAVISQLGHTQQIVICDAGLPIPAGVKRIDLAVVPGLPSFVDVLEAVLVEMQVERVIYAEELKQAQPQLFARIQTTFAEARQDCVSHEQFKQLSKEAVAMIRTGECSPYANIILQSGVTF